MSGFQDLQRQLTAHLRDPDAHPAPEGVEDRRIGIYRRLVFGNLSRLLGAGLPLTREQLGKSRFGLLVRDFLREHRAATPYFPRLSGEFRQWHEKARPGRPNDPPWLGDLILYETEKRILQRLPDPPADPAIDPQGNVVAGVPAPSPLLRLLTLRYPVHKSRKRELGNAPPETPSFLLLRRERGGRVLTQELGVLSAGLLALALDNTRQTGSALLETMLQQAPPDSRELLLKQGREQLQHFRRSGVLRGTYRDHAPTGSINNLGTRILSC
ncbi:MAG: putative DNA-binding domain-containing protein [Gammaproteobacteria bacterium]|nr:putative DNA-binding domain-containing protein [Gammaproteobacteria bacterium]